MFAGPCAVSKKHSVVYFWLGLVFQMGVFKPQNYDIQWMCLGLHGIISPLDVAIVTALCKHEHSGTIVV